MISSGRRNFPDATTCSRGRAAAGGGGGVTAIASAAVCRIAATAVRTAMTNLRNILIFPQWAVGVQERVLCHPCRSWRRGNVRQVNGYGLRTARDADLLVLRL